MWVSHISVRRPRSCNASPGVCPKARQDGAIETQLERVGGLSQSQDRGTRGGDGRGEESETAGGRKERD